MAKECLTERVQRFIAGVVTLWVYDYFLTLSDEVNVSFAHTRVFS